MDKSNSLKFSTRENKSKDLTEYYNLMYQYKNDCLAASIEYKSDKFPFSLVHKNDKNSYFCNNRYLKSFKFHNLDHNLDISMNEVISTYIYNEKFYYFLSQSHERIR